MTSSQKTAVSLLCTVLAFAAFTVVAFTGLFPVLEARYYEPAKVSRIRTQLDGIAETYDSYIHSLLVRFGAYAEDAAVATYYVQEPADADVRSRTKLTGTLFEDLPGLVGIRLVDTNGRYIHYSTFKSDIFRQTDKLISFKDYNDSIVDTTGEKELPYDTISVPSSESAPRTGKPHKITFDGTADRIIFAFPFFDSYSIHRGTMLFYVNSQDFNRILLAKKLIPISDTCTFLSSTSDASSDTVRKQNYNGFVFGLPSVGRSFLEKQIVTKWASDPTGPEVLAIPNSTAKKTETAETSGNWILISSRKSAYGLISGVYREEEFVLPQSVRIMLLVCVFITMFLVVFFLFNVRRDDTVIIRDRIRRFQLAFVSEYFDNKEALNWDRISHDVAGRRQDLSTEIKKSLGRTGRRHEKLVDDLLHKSWDEILNSLTSRSGNIPATIPSDLNSAEIRQLLESILSSGKIQQISAVSTSEPVETLKGTRKTKEVEPAEELEEIPEAEEVEPAEELEEIPEAEEVEPAEELEEIPEAEEVEPAEELEEIPEAEEVEPAEELEEIPEAEEVEPATNSESKMKDVSLFKVSLPDFSSLDEVQNDGPGDIQEKSDNSVTEENPAADLEPLDDASDDVFTFTGFAESGDGVTNLQPEDNIVIAQDKDGLYFIPESVVTNNVHTDPKLRNLVESVLKRR